MKTKTAPKRRAATATAAQDKYFTFGLASLRSRPSAFESFHRHNEIELGFLERGSMSVLFSSGKITFTEGQFYVFWGAMPHRHIESSPDAMLNWLTIPLAWFLEWRLPDALARPLMDGLVLVDTSSRSRSEHDRAMFERWHADLRVNTKDSLKLPLLEAEARLRRMRPAPVQISARTDSARRMKKKRGAISADNLALSGMGKVEQLAAFIAAHYREPLRVSEIAASAGLHPDYAVTLFRKTCGMGLVDYVTQHRVSHAQRLLATTDMKIITIAFDSGFGSASRFYSAFEELCGQSPKKYRAAVTSTAKPR